MDRAMHGVHDKDRPIIIFWTSVLQSSEDTCVKEISTGYGVVFLLWS